MASALGSVGTAKFIGVIAGLIAVTLAVGGFVFHAYQGREAQLRQDEAGRDRDAKVAVVANQSRATTAATRPNQ